jgi:hypothetical protein
VDVDVGDRPDVDVTVWLGPGVDVTVWLGVGAEVCVGAVGVRVGVGSGVGLVSAGVVGLGVGAATADRVGCVRVGRGVREADASGTEDLVGTAADSVGSAALGRVDETGPPPPPPQATREKASDPAASATRSRAATRLVSNSPSLGPAPAPTSR